MYMVIIATIIIGAVLAFLLMNCIGAIQDALNPSLTDTKWATEEHYTAFYYAATLITNFWTYIIAFIFFIIGYWAYIYSQRRRIGY